MMQRVKFLLPEIHLKQKHLNAKTIKTSSKTSFDIEIF